MSLICRHVVFRVTSRKTVAMLSGVAKFVRSVSTHVVDMRSDVITKPTAVVLQSMTRATLDDDVYREDATVHQLETKMADMFGKEAALFVLSGTMGNLIGVSCHCPSRGLEVILGDKSHVFLWEQGGISQFSGLHSRSIPNLNDGTFDLEQFDACVRPRDDPHQPWTGLVVVENTHNYCGGTVIPLDFMAQLKARARHHQIPVHMDGARVFNASVALGVSPRELCKDVDSISVCFSKGIGAPVGSVLVGSGELIARALRMRKALGGGWRKPGPLAAAVLTALEDAPQRLRRDHEHAKRFARAIKANGKDVLDANVDGVHTNIVMVKIVQPGLTAKALCERLAKVTEVERKRSAEALTTILVGPLTNSVLRFTMCSNLSEEDVERAIKKVSHVVDELSA